MKNKYSVIYNHRYVTESQISLLHIARNKIQLSYCYW